VKWKGIQFFDIMHN